MVVTAAVAAVLGAGEAAPSRVAAPPLIDQVNAVRRQLGLVPLQADPAVRRVVVRMAVNDRYDRPPQVLDSQPGCAVCEGFFEQGLSTNPRKLYRALGGRGAVRFGLWRAGWSVRENLSVFFPTAVLVLDPRARTFAAARTPLGMLVVGVTGDTTARFDGAVRWPRGSMDPRRQLWVQVVLPPGHGYPHLFDVRDGRDVTVAYPLAVARGFGGSRLVAFGLNASLAYGRAYRIGTSGLGVRLRTRSTPEAFLRRSWRFRSVPPEQQTAFLDVVRRSPPLVRRLLAELDGAVEVVGGSRACSIADACEEVFGDRARVGITKAGSSFVVLHELGHVVFDLALDERGRRALRDLLARAGWKGACCFRTSEGFADQFAFWALGNVPADVRSYSDRMYLSRDAFAAFLRANAGYRPLSARGLLSR